ncbi:MAG TPA: hypothetical protein VNB95_05355, partial [Nitrososphaera sp.]|nr:hypothetical protein [Nitrososphaera sp.]
MGVVALGTKWIVREIDKITSMGYFIIVVPLFISAEFLLWPSFLDKFAVTFQGGNQIGGSGTTITGLPARILIIAFSFI